MRALVTGGCGFVGSALCRRLIKDVWDDWKIVVVDDLSTGSLDNVISHPNIEYILKPISTDVIEDVIKRVRPESVFHFAAVPRVSYSVENPEKTFTANVAATVTLLESIRTSKCPCRIVNSSSSSVYGGAEVMPTSETHLCNPKSPYALEKLQSEQWCKIYADLYGIDVVSLRYFNIFGPGQKHGGAYSTVLSSWLYCLANNSITPILEGDGTQSRDFTFIDNVLSANILAATNSRESFRGEGYNVAHGESHTLLECRDLIEKFSDSKLKMEQRPTRIGDVKHTLADISLAKKELNYEPIVDFENQVQMMADWTRINYI